MSFQITTAFVEQYKSNITLLSQQKGSKLRECVDYEDITGESAFFDQIGSTEAQDVVDRHGDSPIISTPHSRRKVTPIDSDWGDLIDKMDKAKTLNDPTNSYVLAGSYALGRKIDDRIIESFTGNAYTGKNGSTVIALPAAQKIAVTLGHADGVTNAGLTIEKLIAAKSLFGKNDVDIEDPRNKLYMGVTQQQLDDLLATTEVKSSDYNTVKALVKGEINTFLGFDFKRSQRFSLDATTDIRTCVAWAKSGVRLGINQDITGKIAPRPDKRFAMYVYACMSIGASRMEEEKVVEVPCDESPA